MIVDRRFTAGAGFVPGCRVDSNIKMVFKSKIVKALTGARVGNTEKLLTEALLSRVEDADDDTNNSNALPISQIGDSTNLVVDGKILKVLTRTKVDDSKNLLTGALPGKVEDADDLVAGRELKG